MVFITHHHNLAAECSFVLLEQAQKTVLARGTCNDPAKLLLAEFMWKATNKKLHIILSVSRASSQTPIHAGDGLPRLIPLTMTAVSDLTRTTGLVAPALPLGEIDQANPALCSLTGHTFQCCEPYHSKGVDWQGKGPKLRADSCPPKGRTRQPAPGGSITSAPWQG